VPNKVPTFHVEVENERDVLSLLGAVRLFAKTANLSPLTASRLMTVASELGTNLIKYATHGVVTGGFRQSDPKTIFIKAEDKGPGIADLKAAMEDHFSTGGSMGVGLPGVKRLSDHFEIESELGKGTRVRLEIHL